MGLLSSSTSITRYNVKGSLTEPITDTVINALKKNAIIEIDNDVLDKAVGWTSFESPFKPNFDGDSVIIGTHFVFSLRIDKKTIPAKIIKKHVLAGINKRLADTGREHLSRAEKQDIKDQVIHMLSTRIPATPNIYELMWDYESGVLWFLSNQKAANEELETLFSKSFKLTLVRLFPYILADSASSISKEERDILSKLTPTSFRE